MSEATFVQGDTEPPISSVLQRNDDVEGLAGASVRFQMRKSDDKAYTVNAAAVIVDEDAGSVRYLWGASDLNVPGEYYVQWEVTFASGRVETTDPPNLITIRRQ
jgi:hypothetical protein